MEEMELARQREGPQKKKKKSVLTRDRALFSSLGMMNGFSSFVFQSSSSLLTVIAAAVLRGVLGEEKQRAIIAGSSRSIPPPPAVVVQLRHSPMSPGNLRQRKYFQQRVSTADSKCTILSTTYVGQQNCFGYCTNPRRTNERKECRQWNCFDCRDTETKWTKKNASGPSLPFGQKPPPHALPSSFLSPDIQKHYTADGHVRNMACNHRCVFWVRVVISGAPAILSLLRTPPGCGHSEGHTRAEPTTVFRPFRKSIG